jgi:hypothetical protein
MIDTFMRVKEDFDMWSDDKLISVKYCLVNDKPHYWVGDDLFTRCEFMQRFVLGGHFKHVMMEKTRRFWSVAMPAARRIQRSWKRYRAAPKKVAVQKRQRTRVPRSVYNAAKILCSFSTHQGRVVV